MNSKLAVDKIAVNLRADAFDSFEIFAESSVRTTLRISEKVHSIETHFNGGVSIAAIKSGIQRKWIRNDSSLVPQVRPFEIGLAPLMKLFKDIQSIAPHLKKQLTLHIDQRNMETHGSEHTQGQSSYEEIIRLQIIAEGHPPLEWSRRNILEFIHWLSHNPTVLSQCKTQWSPPLAWPAPSGEIRTLISSLAMCRLTAPFISLWNSDRTHWPTAVPAWLTLVDRPLSTDVIDACGNATQMVPLLHKNQSLGGMAECQRPKRRESFRHLTADGAWNVELVLEEIPESMITENPMKSLHQGVCLSDVEVLRFQPSTGKLMVKATDAYLVHQGEKGERIEPFTVTLQWSDLFSGAEAIGSQKQTFGLWVARAEGTILSEMTLPPVVHSSLPIPGTVPPEHYW